MTGGREAEGDFGFQIAPMVDVVFVLLLFFMAIAGLKVNEGRFEIGLPTPPEDPVKKIEVPMYIDIDRDGNVSFGGTTVSVGPHDKQLKQLHERLASAKQDWPSDPVVLRPAPDARHERVVDVLNVCRAVGVAKLSFK